MANEPMDSLAFERYAPTTSAIGYVRASAGAVTEAITSWRDSLGTATENVQSPASSHLLADAMLWLEPLTGGARPQEAVIQTRNPEWTAYFDCGLRGSDPSPRVAYLDRSMQTTSVAIRAVPQTVDNSGAILRHGAVQLEIFGPVETDFINYVRTISLTHEGSRWQFDATGTVQDFEDTRQYERRQIRRRFSSAMLSDYCRALGIDAFSESFYTGPAYLIRTGVTVPADGRTMSRENVQRWLSINPGQVQSVDL